MLRKNEKERELKRREKYRRVLAFAFPGSAYLRQAPLLALIQSPLGRLLLPTRIPLRRVEFRYLITCRIPRFTFMSLEDEARRLAHLQRGLIAQVAAPPVIP